MVKKMSMFFSTIFGKVGTFVVTHKRAIAITIAVIGIVFTLGYLIYALWDIIKVIIAILFIGALCGGFVSNRR